MGGIIGVPRGCPWETVAMSSLSMHRKGEILRATLTTLENSFEGLQAKDAIEKVRLELQPSVDELEPYPSSPGAPRFDKWVRFTTVAAVKAGWMTKSPSGLWTVLDNGKAANAQYSDPVALAQAAAQGYSAWKKEQSTTSDSSDGLGVGAPTTDDEEQIGTSATLEEARESAGTAIASHLATMPPYDFQQVVAALLRAMGYFVSWIAPQGKDGGLDLTATTDPLGVNGPSIKVQVKRQAKKAPVDDLRAFLYLLEGNDVGLYVSLGGFTADAEALARSDKRRITLIDQDRLVDLWTQHLDRLPQRGRELLSLEPIYFLNADGS